MRIAISGAGVAGTALAYWLHRTGHTPTVIERAPAFRSGGYMIDFWGVGYTVAQRMGLEAQILDKGYQIESVRSVGADGRVLAALDATVFGHLIGDDFTSLPRGDLAATIHAATAEHVEMIYGDSITAIDQDDDCVRLTFERTGPREFDLVIGADGLHSNVRRLAFGPDADFEYYLGCKVAAAVVEGYRPRDELTYVTHAVPRCAVTGPWPCSCSATAHPTLPKNRKPRCTTGSPTSAGSARNCLPRSTMPTTSTSTWSARSG